jgi:hypothetical protein
MDLSDFNNGRPVVVRYTRQQLMGARKLTTNSEANLSFCFRLIRCRRFHHASSWKGSIHARILRPQSAGRDVRSFRPGSPGVRGGSFRCQVGSQRLLVAGANVEGGKLGAGSKVLIKAGHV